MSDVSKTSELIEETRSRHKGAGMSDLFKFCLHCEDEWPCDASRLADALATRVPVQPDDRVYLRHHDGSPKSNDEIRAEAAAILGRVPVQGEPNDELIEYALDYIENGTMRPERRKALQALASRATVPDAATDMRSRAHVAMVRVLSDDVKHAEAERDAALAAIERVRAVCAKQAEVRKFNQKIPFESAYLFKKEPGMTEVLAALDGAPEPEVKP